MVQTARLIADGAILRKESRGGHFAVIFPAPSANGAEDI
jgi:aspartate oxidase